MMHRLLLLLVVLVSQCAAAANNAERVDAVQRGLDATIMLFSSESDGRFLGSGFIYGTDGIALTNAHVLGGAPYVIVQYRDGRREQVDVLAQDSGRDIAILQIGGTRTGLRVAETPPQIGSSVIALGAPLGLGFTATRGIIAADPRQVDLTVPLRLLQHDAAINPGNSGGPLIDETGALVGMNSQIADGSRYFIGISYAVSATDLARLVPQMRNQSLPGLPELGFDGRVVNPEIADALGLNLSGILIDDVIADSAADRAGLRAGDILVSVNDMPIAGPGEMAFLLESTMGHPASLQIWQQDQMVKLVLHLQEPSQSIWREGSAMPARLFLLADIGATLDVAGRVVALDPHGRAARDGLRLDDLIVSINGASDRPEMLMRTPLGDPAIILVARDNGRHQHIMLYPWSERQVLRPLGGNVLDMTVERY